MSKKIPIYAVILIALAAILITFQITYVSLASEYSSKYSALKNQYSKFDKLVQVDDLINKQFLGDVDNSAVMDNMLKAYLETLGDKYSYYMTDAEFGSLMSDMNSEVTGIGVHVIFDSENNVMEIISVSKESPAVNAGVEPGDLIYKVNDQMISDLGYYGALSLMRGEAGTFANFSVYRNNKSIDFSVERKVLSESTVESHMYVDEATGKKSNVGIIRISEFDVGTPTEFQDHIKMLKSQGAEKLIFDVRNNPGGELEGILNTLDYLLPEGPLINIEDADGNIQTKYSDESWFDCEVAVLVNESTASAAELFSSALQDYTKNGQYNAKLVGTTTYGKGIMQSIIPLTDGSGISITTNKYNPPYSENYHGIGVKPDYEVELSEEAQNINFYKLTDYNDNQLQYAIQLLNGNK